MDMDRQVQLTGQVDHVFRAFRFPVPDGDQGMGHLRHPFVADETGGSADAEKKDAAAPADSGEHKYIRQDQGGRRRRVEEAETVEDGEERTDRLRRLHRLHR